jgi:hypothetical protein
MKATHKNIRTVRRRIGGVLLSCATVGLAVACNTDITNPGGARDSFLDTLTAHKALVIGTQRSFQDAMMYVGYWSAAMVFEINPAGSTGSYGIESYIQAGNFNPDDSGDWDYAQEARWTAEDAVRRFRRVLEDTAGAFTPADPPPPDASSYLPIAQALVWGGFANRLIGENFCQAVFDTSGLLPHTAAIQRADSMFAEALPIATAAGDDDYVNAAHAGRAQTLAYLATYGMATWAAAAAEAELVSDDFVMQSPQSSQSPDQYNYFYWANGNEAYRAHTVWGTYWENVADPRTSYRIAGDTVGDAGVQKFGGNNPPWYPQMKYDDRADKVNVASGWEMRLIRAEAALDGNNLVEAATQMNVRRTDLGLADLGPFATLEDAYTALKTERAAELWLEARRMGDIRRWYENNIPGAYIDGNFRDVNQDNQFPNTVEDLTGRDRAYYVGKGEAETNPNVTVAEAAAGCGKFN